MAITFNTSVELANQLAHPPVEMESNYIYGKLRLYRVSFNQGAAVGDIGSAARLIRLPAGKINLLAWLSSLRNSAWTGTSVSIGWEAYRDKSGAVVAANPTGLMAVTSVNTANLINAAFGATASLPDGSKTFESSSGVVITAFSTVATIPIGGTILGYLVVAVE